VEVSDSDRVVLERRVRDRGAVARDVQRARIVLLSTQGLTGPEIAIQAWGFRPGANFVLEMQEAARQADRTIAVFSPAYLAASYPAPEWATAFAQDPQGTERLGDMPW
jgi:hypothetical protein